uniref:glia maturation factor gamma isoform X1 n=1 Tax=Jaculus jaculus TaxID=51337 RepID=UPI001E1B39F5|nr:glia maturation factor gamma isoform X1 [Jaculus jaculus]
MTFCYGSVQTPASGFLGRHPRMSQEMQSGGVSELKDLGSVKVDKDRQMVVLEEEFQNISPEELKSELPERQPRFVVYSYKYVHADGRVSYPLCFIFSSPVGCKPEQQMMYAGSKNRLVQTAELTKVFEIRTTEDLTEAWLQEKLSFFR